ncbi:MAG: Co2+/Mg2+ efflux protein ApaG [Bacteroidetes bacterium]|nr:Co2+/Mg2+ efflux protein ApaG [Bacteroidota bacterium]
MVSQVTSGVEVSVETFYQADANQPEFIFAYRVIIENQNVFPVQLLRRHWDIFDSNGAYREVDGDGVVGQQPILEPGARHQYISGCNLNTEMGRMSGYYEMVNLNTNQPFKVTIPAFELVMPAKLN